MNNGRGSQRAEEKSGWRGRAMKALLPIARDVENGIELIEL